MNHVIETPTIGFEICTRASELLPTLDDNVAILQIELDQPIEGTPAEPRQMLPTHEWVLTLGWALSGLSSRAE